MSQYPHDEFDDIDEATARRGIYRGTVDDPAKDPRGAIPLIIAGVIALLLGASMYVMAPRLSAPTAGGNTGANKPYGGKNPAGSSPSPSGGQSSGAPQGSQSASAQPKTDVNIAVYNSSAASGSAARASSQLNGYTISETGNWSGTPPTASTIYYKAGFESQAQEVAKKLNITTVQEGQETEIGANNVVVVLAEDYQ